MTGSTGIDPLMADLSVVLDIIALKSFQAYLDTAINDQIDSEVDGFKGEELRFVEFESGLSELNPRSIKKLNAVAKFLNEKTALKLGIQGTADRQMDWARVSGKQTNKVQPPSTNKTFDKDGKADSAEEQVIDDKQLEQLARMRANQVKAYLSQQGKVPAKRIRLKPAKINDATKDDVGLAELSLSAQ